MPHPRTLFASSISERPILGADLSTAGGAAPYHSLLGHRRDTIRTRCAWLFRDFCWIRVCRPEQWDSQCIALCTLSLRFGYSG